MKNTLFISYARRDSDFAQRLKKDLDSEGLTTWIDELELRSGDDWAEQIANEIEKCCGVLIIISPNAVRSKWVKRELAFADSKGKAIFPVIFRQCRLPSSFELYLGPIQRSDFTNGFYADKLSALIDSIRKVIGGPNENYGNTMLKKVSGYTGGTAVDSVGSHLEIPVDLYRGENISNIIKSPFAIGPWYDLEATRFWLDNELETSNDFERRQKTQEPESDNQVAGINPVHYKELELDNHPNQPKQSSTTLESRILDYPLHPIPERKSLVVQIAKKLIDTWDNLLDTLGL